jgi:Xaa-Pro aminopeptidase
MCCTPRFKPVAAVIFAILMLVEPFAHSLEKQPASVYRARRVALAAKLHGGVAVLFAAQEPQLDLMPYRQDEDFYYLTGWNEPGASLLIVGDDLKAQIPRKYAETLFLPTRDLRMEKYTGLKLDAASPGVEQATGIDAVEPMTALPAALNRLINDDRRLVSNVWVQPEAPQAKALLGFVRVTLGLDSNSSSRDVTGPVAQLRVVKDAGEIELLKKASDASIQAQRGDDEGR